LDATKTIAMGRGGRHGHHHQAGVRLAGAKEQNVNSKGFLTPR